MSTNGVSDNRLLTDRERDLVRTLLADPLSFPIEFKQWLLAYVDGSDIGFARKVERRGGGKGGFLVAFEVPVGTVDGSNKVFTLSAPPDPPPNLFLFKNGLFMKQTADYTLSGNTITFVTAPPVGSVLVAGLPAPGAVSPPTPTELPDVTLNAVLDGGGSVLTTGIKGDVLIDEDYTIIAWTLLADVSGSAVVDIWKDSYGAAPPTVADSITGSTPPTLSSAVKARSTTLTGWTTTVSANDTLRFNVNSVSTVTRLTLALTLRPV